MHRLINTSISCGVRELVELNHPPRQLVAHVAQCRSESAFSVVLFSDSERHGNGNELATFIRANKLGVLKSTAKHMNPNSSREIRVFMWQLAPDKLRKFKPATYNQAWYDVDSAHRVYTNYGS